MTWLPWVYSLIKSDAEGAAKKIRDRSWKNGDRLTYQERIYLSQYGKCPDCAGALLEGPSGGASTNYLCSKCGSNYNLSGIFDERISNSSHVDELWYNWGILFKRTFINR